MRDRYDEIEYDRRQEEAEISRAAWLAKQAADQIAATTNQKEFFAALQTIEFEPLDCLHSLIGSYLEDRSRASAESITDLPF